MSKTGPDNAQTYEEPTIAAVRRPAVAEAAAERDTGALVSAWRLPLFVMACLLTLGGVIAVFFLLPGWVENAEPRPEPVAETPVEPLVEGPVLSAEERAALRAQAESLLAALLEQRQALAGRAVTSWGDTTWSAYENAAIAGDDAFLAEDFAAAVDGYESALALGAELLTRSEQIVVDAIAAGNEALASGNAELAASQFALALEIEPANAAALRGQGRAASLPEVIAAIRLGDAFDADGDLDQAASAYRAALAIDPDYTAAREALDSVNRRSAQARFERLITEGYAAIDERRFEIAAERFNAALALRPDAQSARDGLAQSEQGLELDAIAMAEIRGKAFERTERWDRAIERYREALATDPTLAFAIEGLDRAQRRADLDFKLQSLLDEPQQLLNDAVLPEAQRVLADARAVTEPGPRISEQIARLDRLIEVALTPIPVTLISDNATVVTVYRVGELGSFASMEVELKPGQYTAVGQRRGYRDVRETFTVLPGNDNGPVTVACVEPI